MYTQTFRHSITPNTLNTDTHHRQTTKHTPLDTTRQHRWQRESETTRCKIVLVEMESTADGSK